MCRLLRWPPDSHQERVHGVLSVLLADASRNIYNIISTPCHDVLQQPVGTVTPLPTCCCRCDLDGTRRVCSCCSSLLQRCRHFLGLLFVMPREASGTGRGA
jgi:hypothetical protein